MNEYLKITLAALLNALLVWPLMIAFFLNVPGMMQVSIVLGAFIGGAFSFAGYFGFLYLITRLTS